MAGRRRHDHERRRGRDRPHPARVLLPRGHRRRGRRAPVGGGRLRRPRRQHHAAGAGARDPDRRAHRPGRSVRRQLQGPRAPLLGEPGVAVHGAVRRRRASRPTRSTPWCTPTCTPTTSVGTRTSSTATWVPTFTGARHLYTAGRPRVRACVTADDPNARYAYRDSIRPILDAGLADEVADDADLGDGLRLEPSPGHTPGHVSLWIESAGERALVTGDFMHHPVQFAEPDWAEIGDADVEVARATRHRMVRVAAESGALVIGTHFPPGPPAGSWPTATSGASSPSPELLPRPAPGRLATARTPVRYPGGVAPPSTSPRCSGAPSRRSPPTSRGPGPSSTPTPGSTSHASGSPAPTSSRRG